MRMAEWKISTPTFQNAPTPLLYESILSFKSCNMDISRTENPFLTLVIRFRRCESFVNGICINIPYMTYLPMARIPPGTRFWKVPIINVPGKLSGFPLKIEVSGVTNTLEVSTVLHLT